MSREEILIDGRSYDIDEVALHFPISPSGGRELHMVVGGGEDPSVDGLGVEGIRLPERGVCDLDGQRLHIREATPYQDDTLGTYEQDLVDRGGWRIGDRVFFLDDLLIDFVREEGNTFRCHLECSISRLDDEDKVVEEEHTVSADFRVAIDEERPY